MSTSGDTHTHSRLHIAAVRRSHGLMPNHLHLVAVAQVEAAFRRGIGEAQVAQPASSRFPWQIRQSAPQGEVSTPRVGHAIDSPRGRRYHIRFSMPH